MLSIIPLVEGPGDIEAVPTLLHKVLTDLGQWQWYVGPPYKVNSLGALQKKLSSVLQNVAKEKNCGAILLLLDLDDGCPVDSALRLAAEIRKLNLRQPVAIVFAHGEYEAWFLASLSTIAGYHGLPKDVVYEGGVENKRDVKGWLKAQKLALLSAAL